MVQFQHDMTTALIHAKEIVHKYLSTDYDVTLVFHTDSGDPEDAGVMSTGDKEDALPGLTAAVNGHESMDEV